MLKKLLTLLVIGLGLFFANQALAHNPRIVTTDFTEIYKPDTSQAFYGELKGQPQLFEIRTDRNLTLYVGLLVPDLPNITKNISATISSAGQGEMFLLDGSKFEWSKFYEEYAGDNYWQGPEYKKEVVPGTYQIKIFSPDNLGKYALVVGEKESFPPAEMLKTILTLPKLKKDFFNKSPLTAFFNLIGLYLFIALVIILLIGGLIIFIFKKIRKRQKKTR